MRSIRWKGRLLVRRPRVFRGHIRRAGMVQGARDAYRRVSEVHRAVMARKIRSAWIPAPEVPISEHLSSSLGTLLDLCAKACYVLCMTRHEQVHISYGEQEADVDEGIADLLLACWRLGIDTNLSCENNVPEGYIWINFDGPEDALLFADLAAPRYDPEMDSTYQRAAQVWSGAEPAWIWKCHPTDLNIAVDIDEDDCMIETPMSEQSCFWLSVAVRFPQCDYEPILARLIEAERAALAA